MGYDPFTGDLPLAPGRFVPEYSEYTVGKRK
jgi:hypothetical protein